MRSIHAALAVALTVAGVVVAGAASEKPKTHTRVLYLQGMNVREAVSLLRSQIQVRQMASFNNRNLVVVAGTADRVEASESLLRERDALERVANPHQPLELPAPDAAPLASTVFRIADGQTKEVVVLLRSIYRIRELSEFPQDDSISVQATEPVLDAGEAMLRELGFLAAPIEEIRIP